MRLCNSVALLLILGLFTSITDSFSPPEDWEASGYDLEMSGSGDWTQDDEVKSSISRNEQTFTAKEERGEGRNIHFSPDLSSDEPADFVMLSSHKSFLDNEDIRAAVIAGGVTGALLGASITAIIIYRWKNKEEEGYILGQRRDSDEDSHKPSREEVVV